MKIKDKMEILNEVFESVQRDTFVIDNVLSYELHSIYDHNMDTINDFTYNLIGVKPVIYEDDYSILKIMLVCGIGVLTALDVMTSLDFIYDNIEGAGIESVKRESGRLEDIMDEFVHELVKIKHRHQQSVTYNKLMDEANRYGSESDLVKIFSNNVSKDNKQFSSLPVLLSCVKILFDNIKTNTVDIDTDEVRVYIDSLIYNNSSLILHIIDDTTFDMSYNKKVTVLCGVAAYILLNKHEVMSSLSANTKLVNEVILLITLNKKGELK